MKFEGISFLKIRPRVDFSLKRPFFGISRLFRIFIESFVLIKLQACRVTSIKLEKNLNLVEK